MYGRDELEQDVRMANRILAVLKIDVIYIVEVNGKYGPLAIDWCTSLNILEDTTSGRVVFDTPRNCKNSLFEDVLKRVHIAIKKAKERMGSDAHFSLYQQQEAARRMDGTTSKSVPDV